MIVHRIQGDTSKDKDVEIGDFIQPTVHILILHNISCQSVYALLDAMVSGGNSLGDRPMWSWNRINPVKQFIVFKTKADIRESTYPSYLILSNMEL